MVTVIIPAHNQGRTIGATIQSVLHQTVRDVEIIVVDDGSTDDTAGRVRPFEGRVRYVWQAQAGVSSARNHGLRLARGELLAFLDGDDLWLPQKLERQLARLSQAPARDAVQCSVHLVNDRLDILETRWCDPVQDTLLDFLLFRNLPGFGSTLLVRRGVLEALGGFGEDLVILEDWDLACRLARRGALASLPDPLVLYRQHGGNRSRQVAIHIEPGYRSLGRLFADPALAPAIRRREQLIWARLFAMLAGGYAQARRWGEAWVWGWRALCRCPAVAGYMAAMPRRWLGRRCAAGRRRSVAQALPWLAEGGPEAPRGEPIGSAVGLTAAGRLSGGGRP